MVICPNWAKSNSQDWRVGRKDRRRRRISVVARGGGGLAGKIKQDSGETVWKKRWGKGRRQVSRSLTAELLLAGRNFLSSFYLPFLSSLYPFSPLSASFLLVSPVTRHRSFGGEENPGKGGVLCCGGDGRRRGWFRGGGGVVETEGGATIPGPCQCWEVYRSLAMMNLFACGGLQLACSVGLFRALNLFHSLRSKSVFAHQLLFISIFKYIFISIFK